MNAAVEGTMKHAVMTAVVAVALAGSTGAGLAQDASSYPSKPIRFVAPEVVGSATDVLARILAKHLAVALGQPVNIDNIFGTPGMLSGMQAPPDGYTIIYGSAGTLALSPQINKGLPYNTLTDFVPVSLYSINPSLLAVHPSLPAKDVRELIALLKAKPKEMKMSTAGKGTSGHFSGVLFNSMAGVDPVVVHYPGGGPAIEAVLNNEAPWTFAPIAGRLPHVRSGKLKALATGAAKRLTVLPEVPTVAESGLPGYESVGWSGIWVQKGTPQPIVNKLHATLVKVIASPELKRDVLDAGSEAQSSTPAELMTRLRDEYATLARLAKAAGVVAE
jgi:tripartite-type tricarboxylate transporter receptor subunit TctC